MPIDRMVLYGVKGVGGMMFVEKSMVIEFSFGND
jgi:hypothetical protein